MDTENIRPEDVRPEDVKTILDFLNAAKDATEVDQGVEIVHEPDIGVGLAQRILDRRRELGEFSSLQQVADTPLVGPKRFNQIVTALVGAPAAEADSEDEWLSDAEMEALDRHLLTGSIPYTEAELINRHFVLRRLMNEIDREDDALGLTLDGDGLIRYEPRSEEDDPWEIVDWEIPDFDGAAEPVCWTPQVVVKPESTEGRPWGQPLKKPAGAPLNLG